MTPDLFDIERLARPLKRRSQRRSDPAAAENRARLNAAVLGLAAAAACETAVEPAEARAASGDGDGFGAAPVAASIEDLLALGGNCVPNAGKEQLRDGHDHSGGGSIADVCAAPFASPFMNKYARRHDDHEEDRHENHANRGHTSADSQTPGHHGVSGAAPSGHPGHDLAGIGALGHAGHRAPELHGTQAGKHDGDMAENVHGHEIISDAGEEHAHAGNAAHADVPGHDRHEGDHDAIAALGDLAATLSSSGSSDTHAGHGVTLAVLDVPPPAEDLSAIPQPAI